MTSQEAKDMKSTRETLFGTFAPDWRKKKGEGRGSAGAPKGDESDSRAPTDSGIDRLGRKKLEVEKQQHDMVTDGWIGEPSFKGLLLRHV